MKLKPAGCRLWTAVNSSGGWCWPPRAFGRTEVFNTGFVIMVLNHWDEGRRSAWELMRDVQAQIKHLTGVRAFAVMRQGLVGGQKKYDPRTGL